MASKDDRPGTPQSVSRTLSRGPYEYSKTYSLILSVFSGYGLLCTAYDQSAVRGYVREAYRRYRQSRTGRITRAVFRLATSVYSWARSTPSTSSVQSWFARSRVAQAFSKVVDVLLSVRSGSRFSTFVRRLQSAFRTRGTTFTPLQLGWVFVVGAGILIRLPYATLRPIHDDSPYYYRQAYRLVHQTALPDEHFVVLVLMGVFVLTFGSIGANLASLVASVITIPVVGAAGTRLFDSRWVGLGAGLVFAVMPMGVHYASWAYTESVAILVFSLGLYAVVARKRVLALALLPLVFHARYEYVAIFLPLLVLSYHDSKVMRALSVGTPPVALGSILIASLVNESVYSALQQVAGSTSMFPDTFFHFAERHGKDLWLFFASRFDYYVYHFLHWGVPYWQLELVNPLLSVLFVLGVVAVHRKTRYVLGSHAMILPALGVGLVYRETLGGSGYLTTVPGLAITMGVTVVLCLAALPLCRVQKRTRPLVAMSGYTVVLAVAWPQARYLLPVFTVGSLYAGYGLYVSISRRRTVIDSISTSR